MHTMEGGAAWDCHVHVFSKTQAVAKGHYATHDHPLTTVEALAAQHGFGHLVLVQPSVYGSDNSLLIKCLESSAGKHRGIVVVDELLPEAQLVHWHALGVRGIRCNWVSPVGNRQTDWNAWTPQLKALGWHVEWYAHGHQLGDVLKWQEQTGLPCVLDHVAGMHARYAKDAQAWANLRSLASLGAWIKLSGWYRLGLTAPYALQELQLLPICEMFDRRMLWGSDWPHTSFALGDAPSYSQLWEPLANLLRHDGAQTLSEHARTLYEG